MHIPKRALFLIGAVLSILLILGAFILYHSRTNNTPLEKITIGRVKGYPDLALIAQNKLF
jgi:hypothetical protein